MTQERTEAPPFEKEVVRLPDGRELTYYRFPDEPVSRHEANAPAGQGTNAGGKEI